ncbi:MAG: hypothetical protein AAGD25_37090 [Cyanobacteria bacterium P01_F01_bin.150]
MHYLENQVLPIVINAAKLSPEIGVDGFIKLNLTQYTDGNCNFRAYCESCGLYECEERPLLAISAIAMRLANNSRANKICRNIVELMIKDAVEFHAARDLAFSTNLAGFVDQQNELRYQEAEKVWQRWLETDQQIMLTLEEVLLDTNDIKALIAQYFN